MTAPRSCEGGKVDVLRIFGETGKFLRNELPSTDGGLAEFESALPLVAELIDAVRAYDQWSYESSSARATGESVYSYNELQAMRERAIVLGSRVLARIGKKP